MSKKRRFSIARMISARANGAKSPGPSTAQAKAAIAFNATKHGLTAKSILLPGEDPVALKALADTRRSRVPRRGIGHPLRRRPPKATDDSKALAHIHRQEVRYTRAADHALDQLRIAQALRREQEQQQGVGEKYNTPENPVPAEPNELGIAT